MESDKMQSNSQPKKEEIAASLKEKLRPYWSPMEAGGIFLLADDIDDDKNIEAFASFFKYFSQIDINDHKHKWVKLSEALSGICIEFFRYGILKPGVYKLENYHVSYAEDGHIQLDSNGSGPIKIPDDKVISFTVRGEHIKLLRHLNIREWSGNVELMDPKRPYGNASYYYINMADALGEPIPVDFRDHGKRFPPDRIDRYKNLHREMLFAVQAFWNYATYP